MTLALPTLTRRAPLTAAAALAALVLVAAPASAHVAVTPDTATPGSSTELTFRVPNEEAKADTDKVQIQIPVAHPIAQVLPRPVQGWRVTTQTVTLPKPLVTDDGSFTSVVSEVTWEGGRIAPGEYQDFAISVDPLPDQATTLAFKALQTYTDGAVVRWIDVPQAGQPEPAHPAPVLTLATSAAGGPETSSAPARTTAASPVQDATWPGVVAVVALVVALVALGLAGSLLRRRRTP